MEVYEGSKMVEDDGCATPRRSEFRIPEVFVCPPPPKKKPVAGTKLQPPANGYFQPPDLDSLFVMAPRHQACA
ncbi:hypothetical protein UlMin_000055 [Ulmus minor]